jgi:hypothetical protein
LSRHARSFRNPALAAGLALASGAAFAQMPVPIAPGASGVTPFVSVTPLWQGRAGLDGGGNFSAWGAYLRAGATTTFGDRNIGGAVLNYDYSDYSFSGSNAFGGAPWSVVQRVGASFPLVFRGGDGWAFGVTPSVDWFRENGANWGDSLTYGAIVTAAKSFAPDKRIGLGVAGFYRLEDTTFFPLLVVDWRFAERWRLLNPLPAGPTGPAGLELDYKLTEDWALGFGAAWRSVRFRLSESGPTPNGVGEERGVPLFLRASRNFGPQSSLYLYAGAIVGGKLRVEDSSGNELREVSFNPQPLLGATFAYRF